MYFYTPNLIFSNSKIIPMRKFYFIFSLLILVPFFSIGQSPRLVLIEEATNASCGPCASQNPAFDNLLNQNRDILTAIKYHWYFPGYDPMHNHNPEENNARVSYYGINGVPTAAIDGDIPNGPTFSYPGGPHGYTQALIDDYAAEPSPFNISMSHHLSGDENTIFVDMLIEATQAVTGNLKAHMVVVEKTITFTSAPGSNGEKVFHDVMKKMIPDDNGTTLPSIWEPGDYVILQGSWELANIYDMDELGVVGFVQNNASKDVHQAANSSSDPLTPLYANEANITAIDNVSETNCLGTMAPRITLRNNGSNQMTSVDIHYRVNEGTEMTFNWTGNLDFLESEVVTLPAISFELTDEMNLFAYTEDPNGVPDEYPANDTLLKVVDRAEITPTTVKLMIRTDANPDEITWEILNSAGEVAYSGGPYANPTTIYNETFQLPDLECYKFMIYDAGGDGLLIPGFYALYYGSNNYIKSGTEFGAVDSAFFEVNTQVGLKEDTRPVQLSISPNPATDAFTVSCFLGEPATLRIQMYDLAGSVVMSGFIAEVQAGVYSETFDVSALKPGMYLVRMSFGNQVQTRKITIIR